jgi:hypothetical protein
MPPDAIAHAISFAIEQPADIEVKSVIEPSQKSTKRFV